MNFTENHYIHIPRLCCHQFLCLIQERIGIAKELFYRVMSKARLIRQRDADSVPDADIVSKFARK
jgi:hypothetical protein